ncbi:hypothetical protein EDD21DRAFT_375164 [Dissophora ornata]|nr:hypothetical protein EDD21DRAFT_375164 [Dissophora ornata]
MEQTKEQETPPAAGQTGPESAEASEIPSEMSAMVSLLASSVQGMQGSLGNAYQSMANQLKQSMEMTQTMSGMMELFLVSSLSIRSTIERDEKTGKPLLVLITENKSQFPIPGISGTIRIGNDSNEQRKFENSVGSYATLLFSTAVQTKKGGRSVIRGKTEYKEMQDTIYKYPHEQQTTEEQLQLPVSDSATPSSTPSASPSASSQAISTLLPGMRCTDVFELNLERFDNWIILAEASFKSPGTGKTLFKKHELCVYLVDQCTIDWLPDNGVLDDIGSSYTAHMTTGPLRQVLNVPATDGVSIGKRFSLTPMKSEFKVEGMVSEISEDKQDTLLSIWCENNTDETESILQRIHTELTILGKQTGHHAKLQF